LKLLNEARNGTERLSMIFAISPLVFGRQSPHYNRGKSSFSSFLTIAKQKKPRLRKLKGPQWEAAQLSAAQS